MLSLSRCGFLKREKFGEVQSNTLYQESESVGSKVDIKHCFESATTDFGMLTWLLLLHFPQMSTHTYVCADNSSFKTASKAVHTHKCIDSMGWALKLPKNAVTLTIQERAFHCKILLNTQHSYKTLD